MRLDAHHSFSGRYPLEHLGSILERNRFDGSILVTDAPPTLPEFVQALVIQTSHIDTQRLDEYRRHPKFRGVCFAFGDEIPEGLAELEQRNLTLDALGGLPLIPRIAARFPSLRIAIDHLGAPQSDDWAGHLERAAACPQVYCKLSRLLAFTPSPRAYVRHALATFGPRRLMFGSDWPSSLPERTWKENLAAFTQSIGAQTVEVREELLGGTAARFYAV